MTKEEYLLLALSQEAASVSHAVPKCIMFGLQDSHPDLGTTNLTYLMQEVLDFITLIQILEELSIIPTLNSEELRIRTSKKKKDVMLLLRLSAKLGKVNL